MLSPASVAAALSDETVLVSVMPSLLARQLNEAAKDRDLDRLAGLRSRAEDELAEVLSRDQGENLLPLLRGEEGAARPRRGRRRGRWSRPRRRRRPR